MENRTIVFQSMRQIVKKRFNVYIFPDKIAPSGQYTFPFSITIPHGCPSSVFYTRNLESKASVGYNIKAILQPEFSERIKEMTFKQPLIIREKPPLTIFNVESNVKTKINSCCGLFTKGEINFEVELEKDVYKINEMCQFRI